MGTTAEKLAYLKQTKQQLKTAINNKGGSLTDDSTFRDYVDAVDDIIAEHHTDYDGPYTVTENGTLPTAGKAMTDDLVVNVSSSGDHLSNAWEAYKKKNKTSWKNAFAQSSDSTVFSFIENLDFLDFSEAKNVTNMGSMFRECHSLTSVPAFDTSNVMDMSYMFYHCNSLSSVPTFDTSNVTSMSSMFYYCSSLISVPAFDTSNVTSMSNMFLSCSSLSSVPAFNTSKVTDMSYMFSSCSSLSSVPAFDTSNVTSMRCMFQKCGSLTSVSTFDTSKVTDMNAMFYLCNSLSSVPTFDTSKVTDMSYMLESCSSLKEVHMFGMKVNFDISSSTKFTREALLEIINNCQDLTGQTSHRIQMGSTNLAKLTDEDKLIATNKNWTLA